MDGPRPTLAEDPWSTCKPEAQHGGSGKSISLTGCRKQWTHPPLRSHMGNPQRSLHVWNTIEEYILECYLNYSPFYSCPKKAPFKHSPCSPCPGLLTEQTEMATPVQRGHGCSRSGPRIAGPTLMQNSTCAPTLTSSACQGTTESKGKPKPNGELITAASWSSRGGSLGQFGSMKSRVEARAPKAFNQSWFLAGSIDGSHQPDRF